MNQKRKRSSLKIKKNKLIADHDALWFSLFGVVVALDQLSLRLWLLLNFEDEDEKRKWLKMRCRGLEKLRDAKFVEAKPLFCLPRSTSSHRSLLLLFVLLVKETQSCIPNHLHHLLWFIIFLWYELWAIKS